MGIEMALVLIRNEYNVTLIEKGDSFAANMSSWKHVSLFSPNHLNMSETGREVLKELGKVSPAGKREHCAFGDMRSLTYRRR